MKKPLVKPKETTSYTKTQAENDNIELATIKAQIKQLKVREEELINRLTNYMLKSVSEDGKGHRLFTVTAVDGTNKHLQRQRRRKITLNNEKALSWLRAKKFTKAIKKVSRLFADVTQDQVLEVMEQHASHFVEKIEMPDEDALAQMVLDEKITMAEFEALCHIDDTYAMTYIKDEDVKKAQEAAGEEVEKPEEGKQDATTTNRKAVHTPQRKASPIVPNRKVGT